MHAKMIRRPTFKRVVSKLERYAKRNIFAELDKEEASLFGGKGIYNLLLCKK
jgi:hypothetical protein